MTARDLIRHRMISVGDAADVLARVLDDANRVLLRKAEYSELMDALKAFGMREFPTDSAKLRRLKQAYVALSQLPVE